MCGIFGIVTKKDNSYSKIELIELFKKLALYSEVRGKDSSGLTILDNNSELIKVLKGPLSISDLIANIKVKSELNTSFSHLAFGHARLTTNGSHLKDINNQPVIKDGLVCVHNGIITNADELWDKNPELKRNYDIDTEIFLALVKKYLIKGFNTIDSISKSVKYITGTISIGLLLSDRPEFALLTNNGSLYILTDERDLLVFASEKYFLEQIRHNIEKLLKNKRYEIRQVLPNTGLLIDTENFVFKYFDFNSSENLSSSVYNESLKIIETAIPSHKPLNQVVVDISEIGQRANSTFEKKLLEYNIAKISALKKCTKCLLPSTFPFIEFDADGVCNYCKNYVKKNEIKSIDELGKLVAPYRSRDNTVDCIVPFSGGRDSTYTLHIVKNILKLNPIAFTYDWGMVTDLGRRNIARVCGKLGVENIIVSADIKWKRENIKKNIIAWLKKPSLGMIPLFMAGDKYFFYYADKIKKQNNVALNIWGTNPLENTDFKVGFAKVPPSFNKKTIYSLSIKNQFRLFSYVGRNILTNPAYINKSVFDTFGSFLNRYLIKKEHYYHLFDYYRWDEKEIEELIINEYKWEKAIDTDSTWRIGDGTSAFYNYIYYTVAGFSEFDTFRSNQIREGMLDRTTALNLVEKENKPRYESLKWYLEIIGLDFESTIKRINQIPKLY